MSTGAPASASLPALDGDTVLLGRLAIALAGRFPQWVRRRTTTLTFLDDKTLVQRLAVSMTVPAERWFGDLEGRALATQLAGARLEHFYLPLNIVTKGTLAAFRISDADDRTISMRNRVERCRLTVDGFSSLVDERAAQQPGLGVGPGSLRQTIDDIVAAPDAERGRLAWTTALTSTPLGQLLPQGDPYRTLLRMLSTGFMILVPVPFERAEGLFYVRWEESTRWVTNWRLGSVVKLLGSSVGFWSKELFVRDYNIGWAQSTHFVVEEPADVHNLHTRVVEQVAVPPQLPNPRPRLHEVWARPRADVSIPLRDPADPLAGSEDQATIRIDLVPRRSGAFGAVTTVAWVSFALLWIISRHLTNFDLEASTTVAVVLPAILAASLVRQGEHAIAGLLLAGVRVCGLLVVLFVFAAAAFMAATDPQTRRVPERTTICQLPAMNEASQAPTNPFLVPPLDSIGLSGRSVVCSVHELGGVRVIPPRSEERAVRVGMFGTLAVAIVLTIGMVATCVRIALARGRPARRTPV